MASKKQAKQVKKMLTENHEEFVKAPTRFLSTGMKMLNVACSGNVHGGIPTGSIVGLIGDSNSGKTMAVLSILAEAANDPDFKDYDLIFDIPEGGAQMDATKFFGSKLVERMQPPAWNSDDTPAYSRTLEEMYDTIKYLQKQGRPFIYGIDSQDVLSCEAEIAKASKNASARSTGKETKGEYDPKARVNSSNMRQIVPELKQSGSILLIVSQTRDKIGQPIFFGGDNRTRSGGHALTFYADIEIWLTLVKKLRRPVNQIKRQYGILSKMKVKRTRVTGKEREVYIPILSDYGIDDMGSCVDFLVVEGYWDAKTAKGTGEVLSITAPEFDFDGKREQLIQTIEDMDAEQELFDLVQKVWDEIEEELKVKRKSRYV